MAKPALKLEELAAITAAIESRGERDVVLAERGIDPDRFDSAREAWMREIAERAASGDRALALRWTSLLLASKSTERAQGIAAKKRRPGGKAPVAPHVRASVRHTRAKPGPAQPSTGATTTAEKSDQPRPVEPAPVVAPPGMVPAPREARRAPRTLMISAAALAAQAAPLPFAGASVPRSANPPSPAHPPDAALPFGGRSAEPASPPPAERRARPPAGDDPMERTAPQPAAEAVRSALPFDRRALEDTSPLAPRSVSSTALPFAARPTDDTGPITAAAAHGRAVLPFEPAAPAAPGAPRRAPSVPPKAKERDLRGSTLSFAAVNPLAAAMPFMKSGAPASQPPPPPVSEAEARRKAEAFTLAQYARLGAELRFDPTQAPRLRATYGIDEVTWLSLHQVWKERFAATPTLRARWESQVDQILSKLRGK